MSGAGELVKRIYSNFRGVDFRGEEINLSRSPDSLNMWRDYTKTESICTRPGMKKVLHIEPTDTKDTEGNVVLANYPVNGLYFIDNKVYVHYGNYFERYIVDGDAPLVKDEGYSKYGTSGNARSAGSFWNGELYMVDGGYYSTSAHPTHPSVWNGLYGYIPTTSIGRKPEGGGTIYEDVNLLSHYRKNSFVGDGKSTVYHLDATDLDETDIEYDSEGIPIGERTALKIFVNGTDLDDYGDGIWSYIESFDAKKGTVTFKGAPPAPATDGQDNVIIRFKKTVQEHADKINKCTLMTVFDNRIFVSGNPDYPNYVWHSSLYDPTYFSDRDVYQEGTDNAKVKGMVAGNNALWVFRDASAANSTIFYHVPTIDEGYGKLYPSAHSSIALGCVGGATNFNDDIVFFSPRGMEGISSDVTTEQVVAHRSSLIDRKLIAEPGYENMILAEWKGYLIVFIGNKAYLADSRATFTNEDHMEYEWYYWEMEKEITCAAVHNDVLYLGTDDGVYTLTDYDCDIESYWVTPKDKLVYPHMQKTTNKRGCVVEAKGDISVYVKVEDTEFEPVGEYRCVLDYFVSRIKRKKFKDIQLKFHSNTWFSLETATLEAWVGGYIKR